MHNNHLIKLSKTFDLVLRSQKTLRVTLLLPEGRFFIHTSVKNAYAKRTVIFFDRVSEIIIICIIEWIIGPGISVCDIFFSVPVTLPVSDVF